MTGERIPHGGGLDAAMARYGGERSDWLDLSTGINPYAYPLPKIDPEAWQRLPDRDAEESLVLAARYYYSVPGGMAVVAANGTQALIELLPRVLDVRHVAVVAPTYGEHAHVWRKSGAIVDEIGRGETVREGVRALVLVNPNNPNGAVETPERLLLLAAEMKKRDGWLIVDEAFCDTSPEASLVPCLPDNVLVLCSFGKFFGLAGLRLGFVICSPGLAGRFSSLLGPWGVSGPALAVGAIALGDRDWILSTRNRLSSASQRLAARLEGHGLEICGAHPLFVFTGHQRAGAIAKGLAERHILVRCFGEMPDRLRFGLCSDDAAFDRLDAVLAEIMPGPGSANFKNRATHD